MVTQSWGRLNGCYRGSNITAYQPSDLNRTIWGWTSKKLELVYKILCITCLNFIHLQSTLHLIQYTYWDLFSTAQFWAHWFWCLLVLLQFFFSPPHWQNISPGGHFSPRETKSHLGRDWVNREGGARGSSCFWSETTEHCSVGRGARESPIMKWANALTESSKNIPLKPSAASHTTTNWCTDTDGFLEHSPSSGSLYYKGPALQKIILGFFGIPPCTLCYFKTLC